MTRSTIVLAAVTLVGASVIALLYHYLLFTSQLARMILF